MSRETAATKRKTEPDVVVEVTTKGEATETTEAAETKAKTAPKKSSAKTSGKSGDPTLKEILRTMTEGFDRLDGRFGRVDERIDGIDERLKKLEGKTSETTEASEPEAKVEVTTGTKAPEAAPETKALPESTEAKAPEAKAMTAVDKDGFVRNKILGVAYRWLDWRTGRLETSFDIFAAKQASGDRYIPVYVWKTADGKWCDDLTSEEIAKYLGAMKLEAEAK